MSFLNELINKKSKLKQTETIVTKVDGQRYVEKCSSIIPLESNAYGFVVDTKPDNIAVLITNYLYIGSQDCVAPNIIEDYKIKHVLSLGINIDVTIDKKFINCLDLPETDIKEVLNISLPYIRMAVESKENILVHCNAGVSRTAMIAIGYLMHYEQMQFDEAYNLVKAKRPAIQPNDGFKRQLKAMNPGEVIKNAVS